MEEGEVECEDHSKQRGKHMYTGMEVIGVSGSEGIKSQ